MFSSLSNCNCGNSVDALRVMSAIVCAEAESCLMWRDAAAVCRGAEPHRHTEGPERSIWKVWRCGRCGATN